MVAPDPANSDTAEKRATSRRLARTESLKPLPIPFVMAGNSVQPKGSAVKRRNPHR